MTIEVTGLDELARVADRVPDAVERALNVATDVVSAESTRQIARIPSVAPARSRTGRPLWRQTGALAASRVRQSSPGRRSLDWQARYAARRFGMWVSWTPKRPAGGVERRNNVPTDTADITAPTLPDVVADAIEKGLG